MMSRTARETYNQTRFVGAPPEYAMPSARPSLAEAQKWCRALAASHYENFHVATWFLPRRIRLYFESVYAFSRVADDLGDEVPDRTIALKLLAEWRSMLDECYEAPSNSIHPVFVALQKTIFETKVPKYLFNDLIRAFEMDQSKTHYDSLHELVNYSRLSANPVGRLVLWVSGYRDEDRGLLSDKVCTALQLINFWQDVVEDLDRGRRYLPADQMQRFHVTESMIAEREFTPQFRSMMQFLVDYSTSMLADGGRISTLVDRELAVTLRLFERGGRAAAEGIVAKNYDVLTQRPSVSKITKMRLLLGAIVGKAFAVLPGGDPR